MRCSACNFIGAPGLINLRGGLPDPRITGYHALPRAPLLGCAVNFGEQKVPIARPSNKLSRDSLACFENWKFRAAFIVYLVQGIHYLVINWTVDMLMVLCLLCSSTMKVRKSSYWVI